MATKAKRTRETPPIWPGSGPALWPDGATARPLAWKPRRLRRFLLGLLIFIAIVALACGGLLWNWSSTVTSYPAARFNSGRNAVWLEHTWSGERHTTAEYDRLAAQLATRQIAFVYAHVGPLESDGTIPTSRAPYAEQFAASMHARLPALHIYAWIGQIEAASGQPAQDVVSLENSAVRARIAQTATRFVKSAGFDGVHYDIEPITNNDARFLDLLDETRALLPTATPLSIAGQKWAPNATIANWAHQSGRADAWWTSYYYASVAAHVDQIAVMTYNTAMPTPQAYSLMVKQQTQNILDAVRSARHPPQVLFGIPTYPGDDRWYHASAENMQSGLAGIAAGLNSGAVVTPFTGVAIYRMAITSDADWQTYDHVWLGA